MNEIINKPEVFELIFEPSGIEHISNRRIETPWGNSAEEYCHYKDVFIGEFHAAEIAKSPYYEAVGINGTSRDKILRLFPMTELNRYTVSPSLSEFQNSISELLNVIGKWKLVFEAECDRKPIEELNVDEVESMLPRIVDYCSGRSDSPASFIIKKGITRSWTLLGQRRFLKAKFVSQAGQD